MLKPTFRTFARNWWPVLVWLGVIRLESTGWASASNTSAVLYEVIAAVSPRVEPSFVDQLDEILRKSGHFLGYGILSVLVVLAFRNTNRGRLRGVLRRAWGSCLHDLWRLEWAVIGVLVTVAAASCDEIHQSFIPSRGSHWQDVVLDTFGAIVFQVVLYVLSMRALKHRRASVPQAELTSTH